MYKTSEDDTRCIIIAHNIPNHIRHFVTSETFQPEVSLYGSPSWSMVIWITHSMGNCGFVSLWSKPFGCFSSAVSCFSTRSRLSIPSNELTATNGESCFTSRRPVRLKTLFHWKVEDICCKDIYQRRNEGNRVWKSSSNANLGFLAKSAKVSESRMRLDDFYEVQTTEQESPSFCPIKNYQSRMEQITGKILL